MNKEEQVLLELLKSALFALPARLPKDTDWHAVLQEAGSQSVIGIAAEAVPEPHRALWRKNERYYIANAAQKAYAEAALLTLFREHGIPLVILKGSAAAVYYPCPSRRWMGDIDFIVPQNRFDEAKALLEASGYTQPEPFDAPSREMPYFRDGVKYELHYRFSDPDLDIEAHVVRGLEQPETGQVDGHSFPMLPKLENGMVLLAHLRHHLCMGIGLRQVIDWMMYVDRVLDDAFWDTAFREAAAAVGLEKLAVVTTRMCQRALGLRGDRSWCAGADEALCDALLDSLLRSGNFGLKQGTGQRVEKVATTLHQEGLFHYLQRAGAHNWKAYQKHRWLKPFCWIYQIFHYLRQRRKYGRKRREVLDDMRRSKERYQLLQALQID